MGPAFDIVKAGHIEYLVTDLKKARQFYVDTLGFVLTDADASHLYLRGIEDRHHHCLTLTRSDRPGAGHLAFRVSDEDDLLALEALLKTKGCQTSWMRAGAESGLGKALRVDDPFGFPMEFYSEMERERWMLQSFNKHRGAKVMRLDHFNLLLPTVKAAYDWYTRSLGFTCTELTETEGRKPAIWAAWLRRKQTCHDVALMTGKGPRVHHAGFAVSDRNAIMDCADLLAASNQVGSMERGPGRHGISNAFFLYLRDPDGNRLELYTGDYLSSDPDWEPIKWKLNDPRRQTFWGAPTPASWFNEAMLVRSGKTGKLRRASPPAMVDRPDYLIHAH
ncbi:MAG: 3,4-dihydroxyphenylacetate 2,3-dioxygenase [Nitrososphaerales archaeon]|nr:3,4-dihydroxyphenylacetate 2,3-dioxygenase [Nitrososphaerales archaeon]